MIKWVLLQLWLALLLRLLPSRAGYIFLLAAQHGWGEENTVANKGRLLRWKGSLIHTVFAVSELLLGSLPQCCQLLWKVLGITFFVFTLLIQERYLWRYPGQRHVLEYIFINVVCIKKTARVGLVVAAVPGPLPPLVRDANRWGDSRFTRC